MESKSSNKFEGGPDPEEQPEIDQKSVGSEKDINSQSAESPETAKEGDFEAEIPSLTRELEENPANFEDNLIKVRETMERKQEEILSLQNKLAVEVNQLKQTRQDLGLPQEQSESMSINKLNQDLIQSQKDQRDLEKLESDLVIEMKKGEESQELDRIIGGRLESTAEGLWSFVNVFKKRQEDQLKPLIDDQSLGILSNAVLELGELKGKSELDYDHLIGVLAGTRSALETMSDTAPGHYQYYDTMETLKDVFYGVSRFHEGLEGLRSAALAGTSGPKEEKVHEVLGQIKGINDRLERVVDYLNSYAKTIDRYER